MQAGGRRSHHRAEPEERTRWPISSAAQLAPIMFASLVAIMLLGYPIAFSLAALGLAYAALGIHLGLSDRVSCRPCRRRIFSILANQTLLAIPFFAFMGLVLERSRMAEDLLDTTAQLFGANTRRARLCGGVRRRASGRDHGRDRRGGDLDGADFPADHAALPLRQSASRPGVIAASGHAGAESCRPSLVLIVLADQLGRSVSDNVCRSPDPGPDPGRLVRRSTSFLVSLVRPQNDARPAAGGARGR